MPSQETHATTSQEPALPPRPDAAPARSERADIYEQVTARIVALLEEGGPLPWERPWHAEHLAGRVSRPLRHNGEPYSGVNVLMLWLSASAQGFASPLWVTFNQCKELGGSVKKGAKGSPVVYAGSFDRTVGDESADTPQVGGKGRKDRAFFLRQYVVFNSEQCEGLPPRFTAMQPVPGQAAKVEPGEVCERFFGALGAKLDHGGNRAFYSVTDDRIQLPPVQSFRDAPAYYATLSHEVIHWTSPEHRAHRVIESRRFASESYAVEELVAELGAAFLCADLGIAPESPKENAAYINTWLKVLKQDKRAIFTAAAMAQKAVDWCHAKQPEVQP